MRFLMLAVLLFPLFTLSVGCSGEQGPKPKNDPNWKDTTNPSNIVVPDSMKKGSAAKPAPAPSDAKK